MSFRTPISPLAAARLSALRSARPSPSRALRGAIAVTALMAAALASPASAQFSPPQFVHVSAVAPKSVAPGSAFTVTVQVKIDSPYHIQANPTKPGYVATEVTLGPGTGVKLTHVAYPPGKNVTLAGDLLPVYEGAVAIKASMLAAKGLRPGRLALSITVRLQGCNQSTCYPPTKVSTQAVTNVAGHPPARHADARNGYLIFVQSTGQAGTSGTGSSGDALSVSGFTGTKITQFLPPKDFLSWLKHGDNQEGLAGRVKLLLGAGGATNFVGALGIIYLLGLALNLTPCVYPLIPITIGYFGRQAASGARTGLLSLSYAFGMAAMYSILGIVAALLGSVFGSQLNSPYVLVGFAILMFVLGLSMFDRPDGSPIWELQLPASLRGQAQSRAGYAGAMLMGLMVGIVAAPCIGPIVVALIQVVSATRSVPLGLVTFFTLGVGLATPYLLLGFGLIKALPRAGEWMVAVKHVFGLLLFCMAVYYLQGVLPAGVFRYLFPAVIAASGLYLLAFDRSGRQAAKFDMVKRAIGAAALAAAILILVPHESASAAEIRFASPKDYTGLQGALQQAKAQGRDVLIDFSASWCAECKELDQKTFHDPEVVKQTANYVTLRFQLEDFDSDYVKPFRQTFGIVGLPTVVHLVPSSTQSASL